MTTVRLGSFLESVEPALAPTVTALHQAIMAARPDLDATISLGMLTYGLAGDFRNWVCSVGVSGDSVVLRFLPGAFMRDPELVLQRGTGGIRFIEFPSAEVDARLVSAYVSEAVVQMGAFRQG